MGGRTTLSYQILVAAHFTGSKGSRRHQSRTGFDDFGQGTNDISIPNRNVLMFTLFAVPRENFLNILSIYRLSTGKDTATNWNGFSYFLGVV